MLIKLTMVFRIFGCFGNFVCQLPNLFLLFWNFSSFVPFRSFPWKNDVYPGTTPSLWAGRVNTFLKKFVPFVPEKQRWGTIVQPYLTTYPFFSSILLVPIFPLTKELNLCHKLCKICNPLSYQRVTPTDCKDIGD